MRKRRVAFCDTDEIYRSRFVAYMMEHKAKEITVCAFSEPELFLKQVTESAFDVVIVGAGCALVEGELQKAEVPLVKLVDEMPELVAEENTFFSGEERREVSVCRYQPMEMILHEVQVLAGTGKTAKTASQLEVLGVFSPLHHEMQVPFSLLLATILAEKKKVLYLNLMQFSGLLQTFGLSGTYDIGDVVLSLRKGRMNPETFLRSVYQTEQISFIPPFRNPEQLGEFSKEDFNALLEYVRQETEYGMLVIDFGVGVQSVAEMLSMCSSSYCLVRRGYFYERQTEEFVAYLQKRATEELQEKMHMVDLPFLAKGIRGGGNVLDQLRWSEFGDFVRKYLSGDCYECE